MDVSSQKSFSARRQNILGIMDKGLQQNAYGLTHSPLNKNLAERAFCRDISPLMKTPLMQHGESGISNHYSPFRAGPQNLAHHITGRTLFKEDDVQSNANWTVFPVSPNPKQADGEMLDYGTPTFQEKNRRESKNQNRSRDICCNHCKQCNEKPVSVNITANQVMFTTNGEMQLSGIQQDLRSGQKRLYKDVPFFDSDKKPKKRSKQHCPIPKAEKPSPQVPTKIQIPIIKIAPEEEEKYQTPDVQKKQVVHPPASKTPVSTQEEAR